MINLKQRYTKPLNLYDNYYYQYYNELILLLLFQDVVDCHHFYLSLFYFQYFRFISLFPVLKVQARIRF